MLPARWGTQCFGFWLIGDGRWWSNQRVLPLGDKASAPTAQDVCGSVKHFAALLGWRTVLCGLGFGLFQSPNNHTIVTSAPPQRAGAASGMLATARLTGQTVGAVLVAAIFSIWSPHDAKGPTLALLLAAGCATLGAIFSTLRVGKTATA